jgi:hypothetical protein
LYSSVTHTKQKGHFAIESVISDKGSVMGYANHNDPLPETTTSIDRQYYNMTSKSDHFRPPWNIIVLQATWNKYLELCKMQE